ncbi:MAG: HAMP domain-containing histidine kinase [Ignavibacteriales bacterium]|nr:MAG: HAMP domain-containing histidine kinase [Ignavibacteriales bacterium]
MNKQVQKIGLILVLIILLPAAIFTVFEITSLDDNERVIEEIYRNQLEAILYSVNQYSEDAASTWANRIDNLFSGWNIENKSYDCRECERFLTENNSITGIFKSDTSLSGVNRFFSSGLKDNSSIPIVSGIEDSLQKKINNLVQTNRAGIERLLSYKSGGYRKILPAVTGDGSGESILLFISGDNSTTRYLYGIVVNAETFIEYVLSPKIQEIARDEFTISVTNEKSKQLVYTSGKESGETIQQKKSLWLLPEYSLGIALRGNTIDDIVRERMYINLLLILILVLTLVIGAWIIFRNVKREVELAQIKSDFVSNVSHELRTPLALISMFAETLEMERVKTESKKKEYYSIISHEANRLGRIVNTILNFSKMEAGKRKYTFAMEDLNDIVVSIYQNYSYHLFNKGFDFEFEPGIDLVKINVDREAVSEAVVNLVDNAVKYSSDTKYIKILTGKENASLYIEVQDKGIGINEEEQKKVFDKFYRVSTGLVHSTKGTGLGLSLVKHIMDAHSGTIELKSKPGEGTTFRLIFFENLLNTGGEQNG